MRIRITDYKKEAKDMKDVKSDFCKVLFGEKELEPLVSCKVVEEDIDGRKKRSLYNELNELVGHIIYGICSKHCEIVFLYVEEKYRGSDYAKELMRCILADACLVEVRLSPNPSPKLGEVNYLNENDLRGFYKSFKFGIEGKNYIIFGT